MNSIHGRRILITGAGNGLGAALAQQLHAKGARVALLDKDVRGVAAAAAHCGNAPWAECDIRDKQAVFRAVSALVGQLGGLDVVVANAGIATESPLIDGNGTVFDDTVDINLRGTHHTVDAAAPFIRKGGYVLVVSSLGAAINLPLMGAYSVTKAALEAYANTLNIELKGFGIKVGTAFFSQLDTDMTKAFDSKAAKWIMSRRLLHLLHRVEPVQPAIDAMEKGIARRSRVVVSPRRVRIIRVFRSVLQPIVGIWVGDVQTGLAISREEFMNATQADMTEGRALKLPQE